MHVSEALYYINYLYSRPYVLAGAGALVCILLMSAGCCLTSYISISDIVPLFLAFAILVYMYD